MRTRPLGVLLCMAFALVCVGAPKALAVSCVSGTCSETFTATGSLQEWRVPAGVGSATFVVAGAGGAAEFISQGGAGALVTSTLTTGEGERIKLVVGAGGNDSRAVAYGGGGAGGSGSFDGGGGGGGSFVFSASGSLLIAAGGGGGGGTESNGGAGGSSGVAGTTKGPVAGGGATQSAGGTSDATAEAGHGPTTSTTIEGRGGTGGHASGEGGGGGGGGYYGGGGGGDGWAFISAGGGGGSSIVNGGSSTKIETGKGGAGASASFQNGKAGQIGISFAQPTTSVGLNASKEEASVGEPLTYTATVSPVPTSGTIAFEEGGKALSGCSAVSVSTSTGKATCAVEYTDPAIHDITAKYSGSTDQIYRAATSAASQVTARQPTNVTLEASISSLSAGQAVTYRALVTPAPSSGTVAFTDGGSPISGCTAQAVDPSSGIASCQVTYASAGDHTIGATFSGSEDTLYESSLTAAATPVSVSALDPPATSTSASPTALPELVRVTVVRHSRGAPSVLLTRAPKGLINIHALPIVFRCGSTVCAGVAKLTVTLPDGRIWKLTSERASTGSGERAQALVRIPRRLRWVVRHYLVHHRHYQPRIDLSVTMTGAGSSPQTAHADLQVWTLPGFR